MTHDTITTPGALAELCRELAGAESIAFDTEFVSEHTYRPVLCLVQVAWDGGRLALVDPLAVGDVTPFWEVLAAPGHETVVHAGREELGFCLAATGRRPAGLIDVQIAAGLVGLDYPIGYANLVGKLLGESAGKGETRTDWRRRPLSEHQIRYALDDARHLHPIWEHLRRQLGELERLPWLEEEMDAWQGEVERARQRERWRRVSRLSGVGRRGLAVAREIWRWREAEAERRDVPPRRVLRDDLIVALARRASAEPRHIRAIRGMERRELGAHISDIAAAVERALGLPDDELPARIDRKGSSPQIQLLGQFLTLALTSACHGARVAPNLVGNPSDVRALVSHHLSHDRGSGEAGAPPPALARGWRSEVVGHLFDRMLDGEIAVRIRDPASDHPLVFEED